MADIQWITKGGKHIPLTNDYMNDKIRDISRYPIIKKKELEEYLENGGIVYRGIQGNAKIYDKTNSLIPEYKYIIRRDTWDKYLMDSKVERVSSEKNKYGDYEYRLKRK